jgi:uncharacterized membrane protein
MASLIALIYPDAVTADEAAATATGLEQAGYLKILDSALVTKDASGKVEHQGERHQMRTGALVGSVLGGLTGAIFFIPVAGVAAGAAIGAYFGKERSAEAGGDFNKFREQVSNDLQPGGAALLILGQTDALDRVIHDLGRHGGTLRSTDLTDDQISGIQAEINKVAAG